MDEDSRISAEEKPFQKYILFITSFATFLTSFLGSASNIALPAIGREFNASAVQLGWVTTSFILTSSILMLPFGRLADIIGRKKVYFTGLLLFTVSSCLIVFSKSITWLIVFRIMQGFSGAMVFSTSMAIVTAAFEPGERGRALGINVTCTYLGLSVGPVLGGLLTQYLGWRSIFIILVPFKIISLFLIKFKIKGDWADTAGEKFDTKGSVIYALALFAVMFGFSRLPAFSGWLCLVSGLILGTVFVFMERKTANPIFDFSLVITNRVFAFSSIAALINYAATAAIGFFISLYLQYLKGMDARMAGLIMICQPAAMALLSPAAGRLSDKINPGIIASIGMGITAIDLVLLCLINENTGVVYTAALLVIMGVGFGLFSTPNTNAIMSSVDKKQLGTASGVIGTMRSIGQMMSMSIAMMLLAIHAGTGQISPATYGGLMKAIRTGFLTLAILSAFGILASLARNKRK